MKDARFSAEMVPAPVAPLPGWIVAVPAQAPEDAAFRSGAALAYLSLAAGQAGVPQALWRDRLALEAAVVCVGLAGRREGQAALRDALHLLRPGDHPGPAGLIFQQWSRVVARPISVAQLGKALDGAMDGVRHNPRHQARSSPSAAGKQDRLDVHRAVQDVENRDPVGADAALLNAARPSGLWTDP